MNLVDLDPSRTIVAVASAAGSAVRGIVRVSGAQALGCINGMAREAIVPETVAETFSASLIVDGVSVLVTASVFVWPNERSYTRQPSAEVHVVGSPPLLDAIVATLCRLGATQARPGEFTLRAFLAGRLDLTQAEAIIGAVEASSEHEFEIALAQSAGGLSHPLERLRNELIDLLAHLEAGLDFVEEDIEFISAAHLELELGRIGTTMAKIRRQILERFVATDGWRVVLIGRPNAGKSSLFNALLGRSAAIVTAHAGTTRDYLVESLSVEGLSVQLIDSAGIDHVTIDRIHDESIQSLAQANTQSLIEQSHLQILCVELGHALEPWERDFIANPSERIIAVVTKADQMKDRASTTFIQTSAVTGQGLDELKSAIVQRLRSIGDGLDVLKATAARCVEPLAGADAAISRALETLRERGGEELIAADLRLALEELGRIVGAVYTDDILDRIFSRFCIGK